MTQEAREPLKTSVRRWRSRWLVLPSWRVLHRISSIAWGEPEGWGEPTEMINGTGVAVCGATGAFMMPGVLSRMGLPRCKRCCRLLGIPAGSGTPGNDKTLTKRQQSR